MSETNADRLKVTIRWVQILDNLEPFFKDKGEFQFRSIISTGDGVREERQYPPTGHIAITDQPVFNREILNWVVYEGEVKDNLVIELHGIELDKFTENDMLDVYRREFTGPVDSWLGQYGPGDDIAEDQHSDDPEMMSNWRICYRIERA